MIIFHMWKGAAWIASESTYPSSVIRWLMPAVFEVPKCLSNRPNCHIRVYHEGYSKTWKRQYTFSVVIPCTCQLVPECLRNRHYLQKNLPVMQDSTIIEIIRAVSIISKFNREMNLIFPHVKNLNNLPGITYTINEGMYSVKVMSRIMSVNIVQLFRSNPPLNAKLVIFR